MQARIGFRARVLSVGLLPCNTAPFPARLIFFVREMWPCLTAQGGFPSRIPQDSDIFRCRNTQILSILLAGLNEHFASMSAGTAPGDGLDFAEDAGKRDHYVTIDKEMTAMGSPVDSAVLHDGLYCGGTQNPGRIFYLIVCHAVNGCIVRTTASLRQDVKIHRPLRAAPDRPRL